MLPLVAVARSCRVDPVLDQPGSDRRTVRGGGTVNGESVVLAHGLWLVGWTLKPLGRQLERAGYAVRSESYDSVFRSPEANAEAVARAAREAGTDTVHLVGHSLGGLVALTAIAQHPDLPPGRVVLLGTPLSGSAAARAFAGLPGGDWLLGASRELLSRGLSDSLPQREIGMIAGRLPLGMGGVMTRLDGPNDGTIAVSETRHPDLADHVVLPVSHLSMLLSTKVNEQVIHFLANGRFLRSDR